MPNHQIESYEELRVRFPIMKQILGRFGTNSLEEQIPWFFSLILSAATSERVGPCCFVLNKTPGTTSIIAVLVAMNNFQEKFPELSRNYAQSVLSPGQRVKVKPSDFVYEYCGIWDEFPNFFKLQVQGNPTQKRTFPITDVLRLEPTERIRPKGGQGTLLGHFELSQLDHLLGTKTGGNNSLIQNGLLLYMAQSKFKKIIHEIALSRKADDSAYYLVPEFLSWGSVGFDGELKLSDQYQVTGEPSIAVTRVPEDLAQATGQADLGTKTVLVDGATQLARHFQSYDEMCANQNVVILASPEEAKALDMLRNRDCPIWYLSPNGILVGEHDPKKRARSSFVGNTIRAAEIRQKENLTVEKCVDVTLQNIAGCLERAAELFSSSDETIPEVGEIIKSLYGILLECSECCLGVEEEIKTRVLLMSEKLNNCSKWVASDINAELVKAIEQLKSSIDSSSFGHNKTEKILRVLDEFRHENWIICARLPRTAEVLKRKLNNSVTNARVHPISNISSNQEYDGIILPAWPNKSRFSQLRAKAVAQEIHLLAYPFEAKWFDWYLHNDITHSCTSEKDADKFSSVLEIDAEQTSNLLITETDIENKRTPSIISVVTKYSEPRNFKLPTSLDGESNRDAWVVLFYGDCYALLTEWTKVARLNLLIEETHNNEAKLQHVNVLDMMPGDYVLFRDSGDKEIIRLIAEDNLGIEKYERVRSVAELWKNSLRRLGKSPTEVKRRLEENGLRRTVPTVSAWLNDPDRIGPQNFTDMEYIWNAAGDTRFLQRKEEVETAISTIRTAHIVAGRKLTELLLGELDGKLVQLDEQPTLLDLDYGKVWVVCVQEVDDKCRSTSSDMINRLLWSE